MKKKYFHIYTFTDIQNRILCTLQKKLICQNKYILLFVPMNYIVSTILENASAKED